jgi:surface-anchored protein
MPHLTRALGGAAALLLALPAAAPAQADDPALAQHIDAAQPVVDTPATLARGHVDVGPLFVDGRWRLMIHDDTAKATGGRSVWRAPERTVLRVTDAGRLTAPDDPAYAFLHVAAGRPVYVVPETQDPDVVWVGWNTQAPSVMDRIDRGATMTLSGVQGPGTLVVYLQSGSFSEPKVLWDSTAQPNPVWLDVNTHTHANWAFSKPGVYLVSVTIAADLLDGTKVTDTRQLRFAVGSGTSAAAARDAAWSGATPAAPKPPAAADAPTSGGHGGLVALILVGAALVAAAGALVAARAAAAKRRARAS